jgi:hypothetical protein
MSTPTPGSGPSYPPEGSQTGQPGWTAPPPAQEYGVQNPQGYGAPNPPDYDVQNPQGYGAQNPQGYGAPNPQGYGAPPQYAGGYGAPTAQRPGMVSAAAIIGIVIGALGVLSLFGVGLLFAFDAVLGLIGLIAVAAAVVTLVGGIQAIQGKSPRLLLLGSYAAIGAQLLQFIWSLVSGYGFLFFGFLGLILPGVIVFLLMHPQSKQYYASRGISY